MFRKAERKKAKARIGIAGPAGSGKTYSALLIAKGLGGKIALIDTENGSGELYSDLVDYDVCTIKAPFEPEKYITAIKEAEKLGYNVIIIDSLSHAWAGEGGLLDTHGKIADSGKSNSYTAWRTVTPRHNMLVETMLQSSSHIIATMRSKMEYTIESNGDKKEIKRVGLTPIQRDGMEYEFTVFFDLSQNHTAFASKDRTRLFDGKYFTPTEDTGATLLKWLEAGIEAPKPTEQPAPEVSEKETIIAELKKAQNVKELEDTWLKVKDKVAQMSKEDMIEIKKTTIALKEVLTIPKEEPQKAKRPKKETVATA